ncbi:putative tRNA-dihydrouridine synthase [Symmachiella dynata]|nr:putative tRNA-dihydrouridine synthase [Symmachiella dynata]
MRSASVQDVDCLAGVRVGLLGFEVFSWIMPQTFTHPQPPTRPPLKYGDLELPSRFLLSPLAGYTNLPFRRIVREIGGLGLGTTDLVNARGLLAGNAKTRDLIATCEEDSPFAVQIFGSEIPAMTEAAQFLEARGVDSIDINMGCPVHRITKGGAGSAMMRQADETVQLVEAVVKSVAIPVSVKMRLGWDDQSITAPEFARAFEQVGVVAIAIHGRTREQGFSGQVSREGIRQVVEAVQSIPVVGNGDIRNVADAATMFDETGCDAISVGRGALANPWIFRQLVQWEQTGQYAPAGNFEDRMQLLKRQFGYLVEQRGLERAISSFRKMGHWYLKSMNVRAVLRNEFQQARTGEALQAALDCISEAGPAVGTKTGDLPEYHIPVPSGPIANW